MRIVIVEDQSLFRDFLHEMITEDLKFKVVGQASDGQTALQVIRQRLPDILILDILIPKLSGIHVAETVKNEIPKTKIIALSSEHDDKTLYQMDRLNVAAFLDKNTITIEEVAQAIREVADGKRYFSPSIVKSVTKIKENPDFFQKVLSRREQQILTFIGAGLSDGEIGQQIGLSSQTVRDHRKNLFRKLNLSSTPELIHFAQNQGFWKAEFEKMNLEDTYHIHD